MNSLAPLIRYVSDLLQTLADDGRAEALESLDDFISAMRDAEVRDFFLSPTIGAEEKLQVLEKAKVPGFGKLKGFWMYVLHEKLMGDFELIVSGIKQELAKSDGEIAGVVRSAIPLTDDQKVKLARKIATITEAKSVHMREEIDPSRLSGFTLQAGGMVVEGSFEDKLGRIQGIF